MLTQHRASAYPHGCRDQDDPEVFIGINTNTGIKTGGLIMTAGNYNITIEQHADFDREFQIKQNSIVVDITGYSFAGSIRERHMSETSTDFTTSLSDAENGKFKLTLTDTQTGNLKPGDYVYDVVQTDDSGTKTRLLQGIATVEAGITR